MARGRLERAIGRLARRWHRPPLRPPQEAIEVRLAAVERDLAELKARVNGLIFVVLGAVVTQVVLKLVQ
ncbi:MAG TPA: hypothetical protein VNL95_07140 [Dehalococcoidia bacterium]|nr:hypothetical protein [Dehalococcoidia bacterium]